MAKRGMTALIVQPTIELIEKTIHDELRNRPDAPAYRVFHGGSVPVGTSVAAELAEYLQFRDDSGQIIFTTHQVLQFVPYWTKKSDLHLLIDEDFQVVRYENLRLPDTHRLVTDDIKIANYNAAYGKVEIGNAGALKHKARNRDDDAVLDVLSDTLRILSNPHWETFVHLEQYAKLRRGDGHNLAFHSLLRPSILAGFGSVFMAAALLENTAIYRLWSEAGVKFVDDTEFASKLRYSTHSNGGLITIYHVTDTPWSKKLRNTKLEGGTVLDLMLAGAGKLFSENEFVWQANADYKHNPFGTQGIRLPNMPHGLNAYSHVHDMVFTSSLNPNPDHIKFLNSRGLSDDAIRGCIYYATCYQAVMRISTRDPDCTHEKRIIVPDLRAALYLQAVFPGSKIEWHDVAVPKSSEVKKGGRPKQHASNAARVAQQRKNARKKLLDGLREVMAKVSQDRSKNGGNPESDSRADCPISIISPIGMAVAHGSLIRNKRQSLALGYLSCADNDWFIRGLHGFHARTLPSKEQNLMISPAMFDPALSSENDRGLANIVYTRHLWLDFEDGDLKPEEFPKLFPQLRMAVFNTWHHAAEQPRFRVVIPTTDIMTADVYSVLQNHIESKLRDGGYSVENKTKKPAWRNILRSGLDCGKQSPCSLFYLPSQAEVQKDSFFHYYDDAGREFLDAPVWIENTLIPIAPAPVDREQQSYQQPQTINQAAVDDAIAKWQTTPKGRGHDAFFQLAVDLRGAGMGGIDIKFTLGVQSHFGKSSTERKAEIPDIMRSLQRSRIRLQI
jgi:hypothetical protein